MGILWELLKYSFAIIVGDTFYFVDKPNTGCESLLNILVREFKPVLIAEAFLLPLAIFTLAIVTHNYQLSIINYQLSINKCHHLFWYHIPIPINVTTVPSIFM